MDRIYRHARSVIALMTVTIRDPDHLSILWSLRSGGTGDFPPGAGLGAAEVMSRDEWFDRAWTLQEKVQSARLVDFLIPLDVSEIYRRTWCQYSTCCNDAIVSQKVIYDLGGGEHVRPEWRTALATGYRSYKERELNSNMDLTKHRLACFHSLRSLIGKELALAPDGLSIIANMSAYSIA